MVIYFSNIDLWYDWNNHTNPCLFCFLTTDNPEEISAVGSYRLSLF